MPKAVALEKLTDDARRVLDDFLSADEPVVIYRNGRSVGTFVGYDATVLDLEEEAAVRAAVAQGEVDLETGNCMTLDEFKACHAVKLKAASK